MAYLAAIKVRSHLLPLFDFFLPLPSSVQCGRMEKSERRGLRGLKKKKPGFVYRDETVVKLWLCVGADISADINADIRADEKVLQNQGGGGPGR